MQIELMLEPIDDRAKDGRTYLVASAYDKVCCEAWWCIDQWLVSDFFDHKNEPIKFTPTHYLAKQGQS